MNNKINDIETLFKSLLKGEYSSLSLSFNEYQSPDYLTLKEYEELKENNELEWTSDEEHMKALEKNSVWILQWYPNTPIGSYSVAASSLEAIFNYVKENGI